MMKIVNNTALRDKLDSISMDIKTYANMGASIGDHLPDESRCLTDEQEVELLEIRKRVKALSRSLKDGERYN